MKRYLLILAAAPCFAGWGCASGGYTRAEYAYAEPTRYAEPAQHVYVVPVDRVVVVSREVLVTRGWTVYRVQRSGRNRVIWARRGDDEIVRIFVDPRGDRVFVRGLREEREYEDDDRRERRKHKRWAKRGAPRDIIAEIDIRLRAGEDPGADSGGEDPQGARGQAENRPNVCRYACGVRPVCRLNVRVK